MDNQNTDPKQALVDKLKQSTNILVTVSANPSVDQLAACLGLTIWLNKIEKHATAVFSGDVPSTLEFLQPEATLEKNTDSLRDFIISLDKSKADKLRYKVEDKVVKIFITPYRTSLSADDLEFSQGDFNVDMVIALGVHAQEDLDAAITAHGRILHDATVATITTGDMVSELGSISWHDTQASSLSELVVDLENNVDKTKLDGQIATALLTGIVAETARFSNDKTTPQTMSISAQLMSAGANQQLVASKLEEPKPAPEVATPEASESSEAKPQDGTLEIDHPVSEEVQPDFELPAPTPVAEGDAPEVTPKIADVKVTGSEADNAAPSASRIVTEPPTLGGTLTANSRPDDVMLEPSSDPLSEGGIGPQQPLLGRDQPAEPAQPSPEQPAPPDWMPPQPWMDNQAPGASPSDQTLADIEREVGSPHAGAADAATEPTPDLNSARDEVMKAIGSTPDPSPAPIQALNAQPINLDTPTNPLPAPPPPSTEFDPVAFGVTNDPDFPTPAPAELTGPVAQPFTLPVPDSLAPPPANPVPPTSAGSDPSAPPPVPPPMMPPGFPPAR